MTEGHPPVPVPPTPPLAVPPAFSPGGTSAPLPGGGRAERTTYVLVDGENIDATLGSSILGRRPHSDERPRWDRVLRFVEREFGAPVRGLFFLAINGELPGTFVQALTSIGFRPVPLSGEPGQKVVDIAIERTITAVGARDADLLLVSHDGDFLAPLEPLCDDEGRRVGLLAFREFRNTGYHALHRRGLEFFDLEDDVDAFTTRLPRLRIIPISEFDPEDFL